MLQGAPPLPGWTCCPAAAAAAAAVCTALPAHRELLRGAGCCLCLQLIAAQCRPWAEARCQ